MLLQRAEYDAKTKRAYVEFRERNGDAIATTIFSYRTTERLSKGQLRERGCADGSSPVEEGCCSDLVPRPVGPPPALRVEQSSPSDRRLTILFGDNDDEPSRCLIERLSSN